MNSMTGFGTGRHRARALEVDVHVKSVNGRFLELRFHLPKEYAPLETELRQAFRGWARGTVDVYVQRRSREGHPGVHVNEARARHWAKTLRDLNRRLGLDGTVSLRDVLAMPRVLESDEPAVDVAREIPMVRRAAVAAARACRRARDAEGRRLRADILGQLTELGRLVARLTKARAGARAQTRSRLGARVAALGGEGLDPARLALETALAVDKSDVHEELVRLTEHVRACRALARGGGAVGKRLEFYGQELLREVNTIGAKGGAATPLVIAAKSIIEKFREQVQNIE